MKFVIALVSYLESLGYDTSSLRKSADGSKAIVHMQYAEILSKNLDTNANVTIYDRVNPDFQALLASDEWNGNVTGTPNSFGDLAELAKYEARLTAQVTEAKTDMDNFQIEIAGEVTTAKEDLNAIVDNYQVTVNQQLEQTATKAELSGVASPLAVSLVSQMTDIARVYVYLGVEVGYTAGNWYSHNGTTWVSGGVYQASGIADGSISGTKINTAKIEALGVDLSEGHLIDNKYVDQYGVEGTHANGTTGGVTDFIAVTPGEKLRYFAYTNDVRFIGAAYNAAQTFIGPLSVPATINTTAEYVVPESIAFVRVNYSDATLAHFFVSKVTEQKYNPIWLSVDSDNIADGGITLPKLEGASIVHKNLFDKTKATAGLYINQQGGTAAAAGYYASDYMPVEENTTYTQYATYYVSFYDINKVFISSINGKSVVSPAGAAWARTSAQTANIDVFQFEKGPISTLYEPYGSKFVLGNLKVTIANILNKWFGKTANVIGDSITYGAFLPNINDRYSNLLAQDLGMTVRNYGISSTLITRQTGYPNSFVERYSAMDNAADLIVVFGGTNDYFFGTGAIGATSSTDDTTFNGALNTLITGLQNKYPDAEIVFITPYSQAPDTRNTDNPNATTGLNLKGYRDCILERCSYHGVPVLDLYAMSGIDGAHNATQKAKYLLDGCHPNRVGNRRIADRLIGLLKTL